MPVRNAIPRRPKVSARQAEKAARGRREGLEAYLEVEERDQTGIEPRNLRRLIRHILNHPWPLAGGVLMILFATAATLLEPRLFGYAIDEAIVPRKWEVLERLSALYLLVVCVRVGAMISQSYLFEMLGQRVTHELRGLLFSHLQRLPLSVYDRTPAGKLLTRVTNDVASLSEMFTAGFVSMVSNALIVVGILIWLVALDVRVGLISAAVFPAMMAAGVYFSRRLKLAYREARSKLSALNAFLAENLMGIKVLQLFNRQRLHIDRFDRINQWYADAQIGTIRVYALFQPVITLCAGISVALVIWFGGRETLAGAIKVGVLFSLFSYALALFQPVREIADKWNIFLSGMTSAERIFSILSWPTELETIDAPASPIETLQGHIVFENVWFAYQGEHWVLRDFSLELRPGTKVGVVGHTGAGKTTLISLLMRFYEPQRGRILIDGRDIRDFDKRALRASIGIIQQDVFLFSGSYRDNIQFWREEELPEVRQALSELGYERWLDSAGEPLAERGANLSTGERQVLAFVRALAARPRIWILDEATANMDSGTEERLGRALDRASRGRTSILIAHRLATVRTADLILVLHKGSLVESGTHRELLDRNGLYARLYRYQRAQRAAGLEGSLA